MTRQARVLWEAAFQRLRLALLGKGDVGHILDQSRARIREARDVLERTALQPRYRPFAHFAPPSASEVDDDGLNYFALILDDCGLVSTHKLLARDDDQAVDQAWVRADEHAFDVWDGWRFIERFDPATP